MPASFTHLLDTSVYCQPIKAKPSANAIKRWQKLDENTLCISAICEAEILQGLYHKNSEKLWDFYRECLQNRLPLLPIDAKVADIYGQRMAEAWAKGKPRPELDLLIAATAIAHDLILATLNPKDFEHIEGLQVEDWNQKV